MHIVIIGAGIAGLTAAIALRKKGIEVTVLEQASALTEIGAGIQIASNGSLILRELGLEDAVRQRGVMPLAYDIRDISNGKLLYCSPLGLAGAKHWGAPLYNVHRADLIDILASELPPGVLKLEARCTGFSQNASGVSVQLASGEVIRGDALIGADGIHSIVRKSLCGEEEIQFSNILMWRALIPAERLVGIDLPERGNYWVGPGRSLITYWVRSKNLYSVLASVPAEEVHRESWTESGDIEDLRRSFSNIVPKAQKMMDQIETGFVTGMYYRDPIDRWTFGRVTLMGDAAHPMVPFLAQGACQGMEDAWILASVLGRGDQDIEAALTEYEQRRRPRTTRVQSGARAMVKMIHESEPARINARNGRWRGMQHIDPMTAATWGFVWDYNAVESAHLPAGEVQGLSATREAKTLKRSESQRAFKLWKNLFTPEHIAQGHDGMRMAYEDFLLTNFPVPSDLAIEEIELSRIKSLRVPAPATATTNQHTVLHFHGGGYMVGSARSSVNYAARLARSLNANCITVDYRLAPEHPYPAAIDDALDAYRGLLREGVPAESILLSGESAGGGLALALALVLKGAGEPMPAGIIAISPFTDLALTGSSLAEFSGDDPAANRDSLAYMAASYFQGHEPTDPLVSPLYGDLRGLPPLYLAAAQGEVLFSDTLRLAQKARDALVPVKLNLVEDSVHIFTIFPFLPETEETFAHIREWAADGCKWPI